jgi:5-methylcytosine-specific restriction endonuclease McrA
MGDVRQSAEWQALVRWAQLTLPWVCHLCDQPIRRDVDHRHPLSYALDHVVPVKLQPELALAPSNVAPSHRQCNSWRKHKPLTPGLKLECQALFGDGTPPVALRLFDIG